MSRKCLYPFTNITINPMGHVTPCCKYNLNKSDTDIETLTLRDNNIEELFNQPAMKKIRQQFLNNEEPTACQVCWDEEASKTISLRQFRNNYTRKFDTNYEKYRDKFENPQIITMDFKFSNLCNLKCRICGPYCSSNWLKESLDTGEYHEHTIKIFSSYSERKFIENEENFEIFKKLLPNLHILEFYGGEPLMQPEHNKIMDILDTSEHLGNLYLYYNSNGTIYEQRHVDIWNRAKIVELNISVDDIHDRFEYQRFPAKWDQLLENITKFKQNCNNRVNITLYTTVSMYNIYYLDQFLKFNYENLKMKIRLNLVHWPETMTIKNIPEHAKKRISDMFKNIPVSHLAYTERGTFKSIIDYMNSEQHNPELFNKFISTTKLHDDYRNQSFSDVFNEYWTVLNENR